MLLALTATVRSIGIVCPAQFPDQHIPRGRIGRIQLQRLLQRIARVVGMTPQRDVRRSQADVALRPLGVDADALFDGGMGE